MNTNDKQQNDVPDNDKKTSDAEREETNKTDPNITELKGLTDPDEPLEEPGTLNPLTGNREGEDED